MPEKPLAPFTDKGKQVSLKFSENEMRTESTIERMAWDQQGLGL